MLGVQSTTLAAGASDGVARPAGDGGDLAHPDRLGARHAHAAQPGHRHHVLVREPEAQLGSARRIEHRREPALGKPAVARAAQTAAESRRLRKRPADSDRAARRGDPGLLGSASGSVTGTRCSRDRTACANARRSMPLVAAFDVSGPSSGCRSRRRRPRSGATRARSARGPSTPRSRRTRPARADVAARLRGRRG